MTDVQPIERLEDVNSGGVAVEQLSRLYIDMSSIRRSWQLSSVACQIFHSLTLILELAENETDHPFDFIIDQSCLSGLLLKQLPAQRSAALLLTPAELASYASRLAAGRFPIRPLPRKSHRLRQHVRYK